VIHRYRTANARTHGAVGDPTRGQGRVLALLAVKPETTQRELSFLLDMRQQSLSELLAKLEEKGFVTREKSEQDGRVTVVKLTEAGAAAAPPPSRWAITTTCSTACPMKSRSSSRRWSTRSSPRSRRSWLPWASIRMPRPVTPAVRATSVARVATATTADLVAHAVTVTTAARAVTVDPVARVTSVARVVPVATVMTAASAASVEDATMDATRASVTSVARAASAVVERGRRAPPPGIGEAHHLLEGR
jgi:hypothetical protein